MIICIDNNYFVIFITQQFKVVCNSKNHFKKGPRDKTLKLLQFALNYFT